MSLFAHMQNNVFREMDYIDSCFHINIYILFIIQ